MERAHAGGQSHVEGSGTHYGMGSALQQFKRCGENLEEIMAEQSEPHVAPEFSVTPGSQGLYKGSDSAIRMKMAQLQPEEFDQAPRHPR
jgi:hypothetical protein